MNVKTPREQKRISDESVRAKSGKSWTEWFKILDKADAKKWEHREIARYLNQEQALSPWWSQMISVGYEHERGIREKFQKCSGEFSASSSRTLSVPLAELYDAWIDEHRRRKWLTDVEMEVTSATEGKYIRAKWDGGKSRVSIGFYAKGPQKAQVAVDHEKLAGAKESAKMKSYWFAALNRLQEILEA